MQINIVDNKIKMTNYFHFSHKITFYYVRKAQNMLSFLYKGTHIQY